MPTLQFYTRKDCTLCHSALAVVRRVQQRIPFMLECIDIDENPALRARYGAVIPVITCGPMELASSFVEEKALHNALKNLTKKS